MTEAVNQAGTMGSGGVDTARFRTVLGHFASGVVVVTGQDETGPIGFTCQSFFSLSLEPPLVAIAPGRSSTSWPRIERTGAFCANILTEGQEALCREFAVSGGDKFRGVGWRPGATGSPVLADSLAWVECALEAVHDGGDHFLVVGRVVEMDSTRGAPLVFYRGGFGTFQV
ncbi:MAG TPA: flavin reductase family protein [Acidimicrobiales bacterium]|nr:flavin reductase family protein [Acidimicrobiales bacterium]